MPNIKIENPNNKELVSVLIAAHNEELHIGNCIKSLQNQSYPYLEIIVIENGNSEDKTYEISRKYAKNDKRIKVYSLPGKQKGPGNAWNFGVKNAKGNIVLIAGADLRYGKDYIKKGLKFIRSSSEEGIVHIEEICDNISNLWARAFFKKRKTEYLDGRSRVFSLVEKKLVKKHPFNSNLGYADDQTIFITTGKTFKCVDLQVTHTNPASFSDTWKHSLWVGRSINPIPIILIFPIFPAYVVYKTLKHLNSDFYLNFLWFLPVYYTIRYFAYLSVALSNSMKNIFG